MEDPVQDLKWGLKWGMWFAVFFSAIAIVMTIVTQGEVLKRQNISLPASIGIYVFGGLSGGVILGLLRPLTRKRLGATVVGILVLTPVTVVLGIMMFGPIGRWDENMLLTIILLPIILGGVGGYSYWEPPSSSQ
jgi:hypothetical protein